MSDSRGLMPEAYCGGAFLIAAAHSVSSEVNGKANGEADGAEAAEQLQR